MVHSLENKNKIWDNIKSTSKAACYAAKKYYALYKKTPKVRFFNTSKLLRSTKVSHKKRPKCVFQYF